MTAPQKILYLNKQYIKEEYEKECIRIITRMQETGEWGEFFDPATSPFPYNDSVAYEDTPETKEDILKQGRRFAKRTIQTYQ